MAYDSSSILGKSFCKQRLIDSYGLKNNPFICLTMCRLIKEKGLDSIIEQIPLIKELGGVLIVVGKGDKYYEDAFSKFSFEDGVIYVPHWASYLQMPPFLAGADFYLQPSLIESGGLMPLTAMSYGTIPIVTLNGGLLDNFNDDNAIVVYDDLADALVRASELYQNKK
jgi:starch synthase